MYHFILFIHSWIRWIILILGIIVILRSFYGWIGKKDYTRLDNRSSVILLGFFHLQLLLGLLLYLFLSPITKTVFQDFSAAMQNNTLRYWGVEHVFIMLLAIVIAQLGRIRIKKAHADKNKFRNSAIYFTLALMLIVSSIPWNQAERLFRGI